MNWIIISIGFLGFVPLLIVLWKRRSVQRIIQYGERVTGIVENVEERIGFKGVRDFQAVARYPIAAEIFIGAFIHLVLPKGYPFSKLASPWIYIDRDKPQ